MVQKHSLGALYAQEKSKGKEKALYYLNRIMVGDELNYLSIEKMCLALMFATYKLRHYIQAYIVCVISKTDVVKYILSRPNLNRRLTKWAIILEQYDLVYMP